MFVARAPLPCYSESGNDRANNERFLLLQTYGPSDMFAAGRHYIVRQLPGFE